MNFFKSKETKAREQEEARNRVIQEELERKRTSNTPWFEVIPHSSPEAPVGERYRWNAAYIASLKDQGIEGNTDAEVIEAHIAEQEDARLQRLLERDRMRKKASSEPWVEVIGEKIVGTEIHLKLDWNSAFITFLKQNGFKGHSEEELVDKWLTALDADVRMNGFE